MSASTPREPRDTSYHPEGIDDSFSTGTPSSSAPAEGAAAPDGGPSSAGPLDGAAGARLPQLGTVGLLRFAWRQLTSMRVALMLLTLLAVAAVPGSVFPQRNQDQAGVARYLQDNPTLGEWLDRLGFFDVYASVWFSAIYILLFVSLIGCILPRTRAHLHALRARPPRTPRRFARFPATASYSVDATVATPEQVRDAATQHLGRRVIGLRPFRVEPGSEADGALTVSAERGYLRETGNLVFHTSLLGLLIAFGTGQLLEYRGQAIITEGRGFANSVVDYDSFERGALFQEDSLEPFSMTLDAFESRFRITDAKAQDFTAFVTVRETDGSTHAEQIKVNEPLRQSGANIYLQGNGFAPDVTVRDAAGEIAFAGPVPFLPEDEMYTSRGVIKVPDVSTGEQIGLLGFLLPTAEITPEGARSVFPDPINPALVLTVYSGDLGLDDGVPQNVYQLQTEGMTRADEEDGTALTLVVEQGQTVELPDGLGTIEFTALPRFVALDLRHDPSLGWVLVFSLGTLAGVSVSLFTPRRRIWVRTRLVTEGGTSRTVVEVAGLARGDDAGLDGEVARLIGALPGYEPPPGHADDSPAATGTGGTDTPAAASDGAEQSVGKADR